LIVEGRLKDDRLTDIHHWDGRKRSPGVIHHLVIRILIGDWPLTILDIEADMIDVPHEACPTTLETVKKGIGVKIVSGYSDEIRRRLGGIEGCAHLTHLLVTMGPAALHGYWTQASRTPRPRPERLEDIEGLPYLVNGCLLWREDGPLLELIRR
jgi:hypothetical protein